MLHIYSFFRLIPRISYVDRCLNLTIPIVSSRQRLSRIFIFRLRHIRVKSSVTLLFQYNNRVRRGTKVRIFRRFGTRFQPNVITLIRSSGQIGLISSLRRDNFIHFFGKTIKLTRRLYGHNGVTIFLVNFRTLLATATRKVVKRRRGQRLLHCNHKIRILAIRGLLLNMSLRAPTRVRISFLTMKVKNIFRNFHHLYRGHIQ